MIQRTLFFAYGLVNYVVFLAVLVYAIGFIGNVLTPTALDAAAETSFGKALLVNLALLTAFGIQHSGMARPGFKKIWTRWVPVVIERSTYVLFSNVGSITLFVLWEPMGGTIWTITNPIAAGVIRSVYALGWLIVLVSTLLIDHFDLFGLRQVYSHLVDKPYRPPIFVTPWLYRWVRHPIRLGWLLVFWATPTMTSAHLVFAIATTGYILIAIPLEERVLIAHFGERYRAYRTAVPGLIPRPGMLRSRSRRMAR